MKEDKILLAHGGGGLLSRLLVEQEILPRFGSGPLSNLGDAAIININGSKVVFSTDSFVVQPLFFPGGNIGELAVYGTVNDICVAGGLPKWLSLSLILEEGLKIEVLQRVLDSISRAALHCGVGIATGDTKVVARGQCDGLYINTAGIGEAVPELHLDAKRIQPGDAIIVSGTIGDHGMAVMTARENIRIAKGPSSDVGSVHRLVGALAKIGDAMAFLRDPTRGGLAAVLHEAIRHSRLGVMLDENAIPFEPTSQAVAEMLGIDLLHSACEGRVVVICRDFAASDVLDCLQKLPEGQKAARIGTVTEDAKKVIAKTPIGTIRLVDLPEGEILPRIC